MKVFYFGCWGEKGHYLRDVNRNHVRNDRTATPWEGMDGVLCPGYVRYMPFNTPQPEGEAALHHKEGWTALAFWDRSVDSRGGCNSVFFAEGTYGPHAMIEIAKTHFPSVWSRFPFEVVVVQRASEVKNHEVTCDVCGKKGFDAVLDGWGHLPPGWFVDVPEDRIVCSVACVTKAQAPVAPKPDGAP